MLGNGKPSLSDVRNQIKTGKYDVNTTTYNQPTSTFKQQRTSSNSLNSSTPPVNNNFKTKLMAGGAGLLGAGGIGAAALSNSEHHTDGIGNHFYNAFSNVFGVHENDCGTGTSVAASSEAMPSTGGNFPMLKDKTNFSSESFKEKLKNLKLRRS